MIYISSLNDTQFNQIMYTSDLFLFELFMAKRKFVKLSSNSKIKYHVPIQITNSMEKKLTIKNSNRNMSLIFLLKSNS